MGGNDPDAKLEWLEGSGGYATLVILAGIIVEIAVLWWPLPLWSDRVWSTIADTLIGVGLLAEYFLIRLTIEASGESKALADRKVAEANERAAKADLARVELEAKLASRRLSAVQSQKLTDAFASIKDRVPSLTLFRLREAEAWTFAIDIIRSITAAGIQVDTKDRTPDSLLIYGIKIVDTEDRALMASIGDIDLGLIEYAPNSDNDNKVSIVIGLKPPPL